MDQINWSHVQICVLLDCCLLGFVWIATKVSVKETETSTHAPETNKLDDWEVNVEQHRTDQSVADIVKPRVVKVGNITLEDLRQDGNSLRFQVSIDQQKQESRVEELADKDSVGDELSLLGLGRLAHVQTDFDQDHPQDVVDGDNQIFDSVGPSQGQEHVLDIDLAKWCFLLISHGVAFSLQVADF